MYLAVGTGSFTLLERTFSEAYFCIIQKYTALTTKTFMRFMLMAAVNTYHSRNSFLLSLYSLFLAKHAAS